MRKQISDENNRMTKTHRFVFIKGIPDMAYRDFTVIKADGFEREEREVILPVLHSKGGRTMSHG